MNVGLVRIRQDLPDLSDLAAAAQADGHSITARLVTEWADHRNRFDGPGEALLVALIDERIVGVGGITIEPSEPQSFRMRRLYVLPGCRRAGVGRALVEAPIAEHPLEKITVHAGTQTAPVFWEECGFRPTCGKAYSHVLARGSRVVL